MIMCFALGDIFWTLENYRQASLYSCTIDADIDACLDPKALTICSELKLGVVLFSAVLNNFEDLLQQTS